MATLSQNEAHRVTINYKNSPLEIGLAHIFKVLLGTKAREFMRLIQI